MSHELTIKISVILKTTPSIDWDDYEEIQRVLSEDYNTGASVDDIETCVVRLIEMQHHWKEIPEIEEDEEGK